MLDYTLRHIPKLSISNQIQKPATTYNQKKEYQFRYRSKRHKFLPHVVKFSGGRSSGMLLFSLLKNGLLDPSRGDVIVFNNTSAEHPNTYRFIKDCIKAAQPYGIPFFLIEFQTYEDARRGEYTRIPSYHLVNDEPLTAKNPNGFHWKGEVFEELLSWSGFVPNQFSRICTKHLKLETTRNFLKDWLIGKPKIPRLGHYGTNSRMDADESYQRHCKNQGSVPKDIFLRKRNYAWQRSHIRPEQAYRDFCSEYVPFKNPILGRKTYGNKAFFSREGVEYVAFIGLRSDEPQRIQRVAERNIHPGGYEGEHVYMPLADLAITKEEVNFFWDKQNWDLNLPKNTTLSNCVYCFLKGSKNLKRVHNELIEAGENFPNFGPITDTPNDLSWWKQIESNYGRDLNAEGRAIKSDITHIGFFGSKGLSYTSIIEEDFSPEIIESNLPCDCTE
ncbi:MAG: hypothetical protein OXH90_09085 [Paracoccaceae bacterium]|nr:hypothetical protein [Paracoccaceae bacterium]MDE2917846.1 hypothetical protein [Paracoccaceae bacterium]